MNDNIKRNLSELENLYVILNDHFFYGELPYVIMTMNPSNSAARKTTVMYGWCTTKKIWTNTESATSYYEISICPEFIDRPISNIASTLLHEMVHLYNILQDIKDCSRNGTYHNKKFRDTARQHGLIVTHTKQYGWNETTLDSESISFIQSLSLTLIPLVRNGGNKDDKAEDDEKPKKRKKRGYTYYCATCNLIVATKGKANLICADCNLPLEEYDIS